MKIKKLLTGALASALLVTSMPVFSAVAEDTVSGPTTMLTAADITFGGITSGSIDWNQNRWYKFTVPSSGKVSVTISFSEGDSGYALLDADDTSTELHSLSLGNSQVFSYYLTPGDYYIHYSTGYTGGTYDMKVDFESSKLTVEDEDNNTIAKAVPVEYDGTAYDRQLSYTDSVDYYTFDVAEQGRVTLNFDSIMKKTDWEIYNSEDALIKKGTFQKGEHDSGISTKEANIMKPGKYTIAFKSNENYGTYTFSLDYLKNYNDIAVSGIIASADIDADGKVDATDASFILMYYAYASTGGTETDINKWLAQNLDK